MRLTDCLCAVHSASLLACLTASSRASSQIFVHSASSASLTSKVPCIPGLFLDQTGRTGVSTTRSMIRVVGIALELPALRENTLCVLNSARINLGALYSIVVSLMPVDVIESAITLAEIITCFYCS